MVMSNIGLNVSPPRKNCEDDNCPFHGKLPVRGKVITGVISNDKMDKTVGVERGYLNYVKKYMRYEKRRTRILAHNPPCIGAKEGDRVRIAECRPISKNVSFVVIEKIYGI